MRRLYRRLAFLYFVSALLFVLIFGILLYLRGRKENEEYLSQLLESVDHNLEEATREYEETVERLGEEYVTHARETAYILENDPKAAELSALEAFRELLGVGPSLCWVRTGRSWSAPRKNWWEPGRKSR